MVPIMSCSYVSVFDVRKAALAGCSGPTLDKLTAVFRAPSFFLHYNHLYFHTGVDKETWSAGFLLAAPAALQLVAQLEQQLGVSLRQARGMISAAEEGKYLSLQAVSIPTDAMYQAIVKSFPKLVKQSKSQALYAESRRMLVNATRMAQPLPEPSPAAALQQQQRGSRCGRGSSSSVAGPAVMFLSLDFEWWERSEDVILEVGWSLWDSLTQQHRSRHWVIKEHLNKANGRFISDNRMRFLFGSSERGSLDSAMAALQAEVDAGGISEGLDRQQREALSAAGVELVLLGHGMNSDIEIAELYEIEWPQGMQTFDTQKLYMAWRLQELDAASAAKALEAVVGGGKGASKAAADVEDGLYDDDSADEDATGWADNGLQDEGDEGTAAAAAGDGMAALSLGNGHSKSAAGSAGGASSRGGTSPGGSVSRKGKPQVQNAPRVRPWPAGPPPADPNRPASSEQQQQQRDQAGKVDRQVSLAALLSALGIKFSKLHNAGNDARFTMEAFLALAGHTPCSDPLQAHMDFASTDARYQRQTEASLAAAAALGWETPGSPSPGPGTPTAGAGAGPRSNSSGVAGTGGYAAAAGGFGSRPGSNGGSEGGFGSDGDWQRNGRQQQQQLGKAWGAAAAMSQAGRGSAGGAASSGGGAWGKQGNGSAAGGGHAWGVAPQQQQASSHGVHGAFNSTVDSAREVAQYDSNPDGW